MSFSSEVTDSFIKIKNGSGETIAKLYYMQFNGKAPFIHRIQNVDLNPPFVLINRLLVEPGYRRCGLATLMMYQMLTVKFLDIKQFIVVANPDDEVEMSRENLLKFYSSFGFVSKYEVDEGTVMVFNR